MKFVSQLVSRFLFFVFSFFLCSEIYASAFDMTIMMTQAERSRWVWIPGLVHLQDVTEQMNRVLRTQDFLGIYETVIHLEIINPEGRLLHPRLYPDPSDPMSHYQQDEQGRYIFFLNFDPHSYIEPVATNFHFDIPVGRLRPYLPEGLRPARPREGTLEVVYAPELPIVVYYPKGYENIKLTFTTSYKDKD
jgi:hypothetical protein